MRNPKMLFWLILLAGCGQRDSSQVALVLEEGPPRDREPDSVECAAFSPDGRYLLLGYERRGGRAKKLDSVVLWDLKTGKKVRGFPTDGEAVYFVNFVGREGRQIIVRDQAGWTTLWDLESGKEVWKRKDGPGISYPSQMSEDGETALCGRSVYRWKQGKLVCVLPEPSAFSRVILSPDGTRLFAGWADTPGLWDVESGKIVASLDPSVGIPWAFSPTGRYALTTPHVPKEKRRQGSGGFCQPLAVIEAATGQKVLDLECPEDFVLREMFHTPIITRDGKHAVALCCRQTWAVATEDYKLAAVGDEDQLRTAKGSSSRHDWWDNRVRIWSLESGKQERCFPLLVENSYARDWRNVYYFRFSPDGKFLFVGSTEDSGNNKNEVWDLEEGKRLFHLEELNRCD